MVENAFCFSSTQLPACMHELRLQVLGSLFLCGAVGTILQNMSIIALPAGAGYNDVCACARAELDASSFRLNNIPGLWSVLYSSSTGEWGGKEFVVTDTGGLTRLPEDISYGLSGDGLKDLPYEIERQAAIAVAEADAILFVVDGRLGVSDGDTEIANWLRAEYRHIPIFLAVNKCETLQQQVFDSKLL